MIIMISLVNTPFSNAAQQKKLVAKSDDSLVAQPFSNPKEATASVQLPDYNSTDFILNISNKTQKLANTKQTSPPTSDGEALLKSAQKSLYGIYYRLLIGKELANRAIHTKNEKKKQAIQVQLNKLNSEINNISASTKYKNIKLFCDSTTATKDDRDIINCLKSDWLESAENVIKERYGLTGDNSSINIFIDETSKPYLAATEFNINTDGKAIDQSLRIAIKSALPATLPNGGEAPYYDDRTITHEMVHAIMGRTMNFASVPIWFQEGAAEFIHGANERVVGDLAYLGGGMLGAERIQDALGDGTDKSWINDSQHYSAGYMAVRYLHEQIKAAGHSGGIKDLFTELKNNPTMTFDQALRNVSNYRGGTKAFVRDFLGHNHGAKFIHSRDVAGEFKNAQAGGDTGGIGGANADNGPVQTAKSVIPDISHSTDTPLKSYKISWPTYEQNAIKNIQIGTNHNKSVYYDIFKLDSDVIGTKDINVLKYPTEAISTYNNALSYVSNALEKISKLKNQLKTSSPSPTTTNGPHLPDAAAARKMAATIKASLNQTTFLSQANMQPDRVLQLL